MACGLNDCGGVDFYDPLGRGDRVYLYGDNVRLEVESAQRGEDHGVEFGDTKDGSGEEPVLH